MNVGIQLPVEEYKSVCSRCSELTALPSNPLARRGHFEASKERDKKRKKRKIKRRKETKGMEENTH